MLRKNFTISKLVTNAGAVVDDVLAAGHVALDKITSFGKGNQSVSLAWWMSVFATGDRDIKKGSERELRTAGIHFAVGPSVHFW